MTSHARTDIDPNEEEGAVEPVVHEEPLVDEVVDEEPITAVTKEPDIATIATKVDAHEQKLTIHESRWNQLTSAPAPIKAEAKLERASGVNLWEIM